ncbi:MAG: hypothetical protein NTY22_09125 [Proteobacteria bacterium]|nr:hypothetical protein [Pseudomonadota bacterium]
MQKNKILLSFSFLLTSLNPALDFNVMIKPAVVEIKSKALSFNPGKEVCFEYSPETIFAINVQDSDYKNLKITKNKRSFCVTPSKNNFFISYKSKIFPYKNVTDTSKGISNMAINNSVLVFGDKIFIKPVFSKDVNLTPIIYVQFSTEALKYFVSSLEGESKKREISDVKKLMSSIMLAGDVQNDQIKIEKKKYYFSFIGNWSRENKLRIYNLYKKIVKQQLKIYGFIPVEFMTVTFIKTKNVKLGSGFQYNNAIVYILPESIDINDSEFLKLLVHEHFHIWNGLYFKPSENAQEELAWFHEGVTNYYALMNLVSSGIISEKEFLNYLSKIYMKYDSSYKPADQDTLEELREFFIVMALDLETMRASGLRANLDTVLKDISFKPSILKNGYDNKSIKYELTEIANWDVSGFFNLYIYSKKKLSMDPYFEYLGLKFSPELLLVKEKQTKAYSKWLSR